MKVIIGKPRTWLSTNIFSDYMTKKYGHYDWPQELSPKEKALDKIDNAVTSVYSVLNKFMRDQVQVVKIDRWDTWSMDDTLTPIILPMLKQLQATKHGAPFVENSDVPSRLYATDTKKREDTDEFWFERWDWVLNEMIWAFEFKLKDVDYISKSKEKRKANGFRLFGKYFECLWD